MRTTVMEGVFYYNEAPLRFISIENTLLRTCFSLILLAVF